MPLDFCPPLPPVPPPSLVGASGGSGSGPASVLVPGDVVEVTEGDLMNLHGKVLSVDGNTITIMPRHEDLKASAVALSIFQDQAINSYI